MAKLIYTALMSLDGYIEDASGKFDWAFPSDELHTFINGLVRDAGVFLYGRRMYETMKVWQTMDEPADFANSWRATEKIVFSSSLSEPSTPKTRIERSFDAARVRAMKDASARDLFIGGPGLAAHAFRAGLVDECQLFVMPIVVGAGKRGLPSDVVVKLELSEERRFGDVIFMRYRVQHLVSEQI